MPSYGRMDRTQWQKPNSKTREPRLQILRDLIESGQPVTSVTGEDIYIANTKENLAAIDQFEKTAGQSTFTVTQTNGQEIISNKIGKSPVFGGQGAGGGATGATANAESLQCLYISAMLKEGSDKPFAHFTPKLLKKYTDGTDTDINYETYIKAADPWHYSGYVTAKYLIDNRYVNSRHIIHRGSRTMNTIYAAKTIALKAEGKPSMQNDKWNPGDIWAVDRSVNLSNALDASSIQNLNASILENFKSRKIVGISLKQIASLNFKAKGTEINLVAEKPPKHTFERVLVATDRQGKDFWSSKNGMIYFSNGYKADIRASSSFSTVGMEAQGKGARAGRVSYSQIQYSSKEHLNYTLKENAQYNIKAKSMQKRDVEEFWKKVSVVDSSLDKDKWLEGLKEAPVDKIHAMLVVTDIAYAITKARKPQRDAFITEVMNIAMAKDASSSAYVKVEKA